MKHTSGLLDTEAFPVSIENSEQVWPEACTCPLRSQEENLGIFYGRSLMCEVLVVFTLSFPR
jgi:hypothetical protein